jgi:hypothetical protein
MARLFRAALVVLMLSVAGVAQANELLLGCRFVEPPKIPSGIDADDAEMSAAARAVRTYVADMEASLRCLDVIADDVGTSPEDKGRIVLLYNNGVEQMQTIAAAFNRELRAFRTMDPNDVPPEQLRELHDLFHH